MVLIVPAPLQPEMERGFRKPLVASGKEICCIVSDASAAVQQVFCSKTDPHKGFFCRATSHFKAHPTSLGFLKFFYYYYYYLHIPKFFQGPQKPAFQT